MNRLEPRAMSASIEAIRYAATTMTEGSRVRECVQDVQQRDIDYEIVRFDNRFV